MPIVIPKDLPAFETLSKENIFVMNDIRATTQDIRPIEIAIVNLMPTKIETETQLMRLLGNSPLQVNITLIKTDTYQSRHVAGSHLDRFYKTFEDIEDKYFDGMIITGAPVETIPFEEVAYWEELTAIMKYAEERVTSTLFICWGAQAGLYYHYGIGKRPCARKVFGVFENYATLPNEPLLKGMNDRFAIPMSRHTCVPENEILGNPKLVVVARSIDEECGISIVKSQDNKKFFFFGHSEYDRDTLKNEYLRDKSKGLDIRLPINYFKDEESLTVNMSWSAGANLMFYNWLNYYVYQVTPYLFE